MSDQELLLSLDKGVRTIVFNQPKKKNAINNKMYIRLTGILNEDAKNDKIVVTIITGAGDYYSSGNDISNFMQEDSSTDFAKNLIQAFIDYPKLLIAVVNGPAIGIAATTAALCDIVYASDKASFDTPFVRLGLCAEGASTYTFPNTLGRSKASELLFLSKKLSAAEAYNFGFIAEVIPHDNLARFLKSLHKYGSLSVNIVKINKELVMKDLRKTLTEYNLREIDGINTCVQSEEFSQAFTTFLSRRSKL